MGFGPEHKSTFGESLDRCISTIYVQIASFRDRDLLPTLRDLFAKAKHPHRVYVGICWQTDETDSLEEIEANPRIRIKRLRWQDSRGCCWARAVTNKLYNSEDYVLQIDSHSRFAQDWDQTLIDMHQELDDEMGLFSGYPPSFEVLPDGSVKYYDAHEQCGGILAVKVFEESRNIQYHRLDNNTGKAVRSRLIAAGFIFARGHFVERVPYDPLHYYLGEEITLAVRAYTHGYNLYTPRTVPVYHLYYAHVKSDRPGVRILRAHEQVSQDRAFKRLRDLLIDNNHAALGIWGPGQERTVEDYERYAGINFKLRKVHPDARAGLEPNPITCETFDWKFPLCRYEINFKTLVERAKAQSADPLTGGHMTLCDEDGVEVFHRYYDLSSPFFKSTSIKVYVNVPKIFKATILPNYGKEGPRVEQDVYLVGVEEDPPSGDCDFLIKNGYQSHTWIVGQSSNPNELVSPPMKIRTT